MNDLGIIVGALTYGPGDVVHVPRPVFDELLAIADIHFDRYIDIYSNELIQQIQI